MWYHTYCLVRTVSPMPSFRCLRYLTLRPCIGAGHCKLLALYCLLSMWCM